MSCATGCGSSHGPCCGRPARHDTVLRRSSTGLLARLRYPPLARSLASLPAVQPPSSSRTRSLAIPRVRGWQYTHALPPACAPASARAPTQLSAHRPPAFPPACSCVISPPAHPPARGPARPPPPLCYCLRAHLPAGTPMCCRLPAPPPARPPGSLSACVFHHLLHPPAHQPVTAAAAASPAPCCRPTYPRRCLLKHSLSSDIVCRTG